MQTISSFSFQCAAFIALFLSLLLISTIYYQVITITRCLYFPFIQCFKAAYIVLSLIQLVCVIEGWISYFLNFILKGISSILFFVAFISLIWWPLDMLCGLIWSSCDYLKHLIWNKGFTWEASVRRWINHFPQL